MAPPHHVFVPVNFESQSWVQEIATAGFDRTRPAVVSCLGVTQYLSGDAIRTMLRDVAGLALGTVFGCGFVLPADLIEPSEQGMRAETEERAATRGHPWVSVFSLDEIRQLAAEAGFAKMTLVTADDLASRYFAGRDDRLRPASSSVYLSRPRPDDLAHLARRGGAPPPHAGLLDLWPRGRPHAV
jgi:O-methyltransferase involved in polyketide biosynthesis